MMSTHFWLKGRTFTSWVMLSSFLFTNGKLKIAAEMEYDDSKCNVSAVTIMIVPHMNLPGMDIYDFKLQGNIVKQLK